MEMVGFPISFGIAANHFGGLLTVSQGYLPFFMHMYLKCIVLILNEREPVRKEPLRAFVSC